MTQYSRSTYWDDRYMKDPVPFDWYQRYCGLSDKVATHIKKTDRILQLGCGTSRMTEDMYEDGFLTIENIDFSKICIELMTERNKDKPTLSWSVMNACELEFSDEYFDCIIDKGTIDSVVCGEGSTANVARILSQCVRVLKPGGVFIMISYGVPDNRLGYLECEDYPWTVSVSTVKRPVMNNNQSSDDYDANSVHYIFVAKKEESKKPEDNTEDVKMEKGESHESEQHSVDKEE